MRYSSVLTKWNLSSGRNATARGVGMARQCTIWALSSMRVASVCGEDMVSFAGKSVSIMNEGCTCMEQEQAHLGFK